MRQPHSERLSDILTRLSKNSTPDMTLGDVVRELGERGFGALILLLAAPNLIPLPPGSSLVFGVPLVFITAQLMIKQDKVWLPKRLAEMKVGGGRLKVQNPRPAIAETVAGVTAGLEISCAGQPM